MGILVRKEKNQTFKTHFHGELDYSSQETAACPTDGFRTGDVRRRSSVELTNMSNRFPQWFENEHTNASQVQDIETRSRIERKGEAESHSLLGSETSMPEERNATRPGHGWWSEQMLVDRSLCGMAALTSLFAFIILVISISASPSFSSQLRKNPNSTLAVF